ncbi:MAG: hypothetical protein QM756_22825 [Polyangiaceae bacterium]
MLHVSGQGVWSSRNVSDTDRGASARWTFESRGLESSVVTALASPPSGAELVSGVADICGFRHDHLDHSPPRGMHQNPICNATSGLDFAALAPDTWVRVGSSWGPAKHGAWSRDGAKTWTPFANEPSGAETGGSVAISSDGRSILWAVKRRPAVYSRDFGKSWSTCDGLPIPGDGPAWAQLSLQLASDRVNPGTAYAFDTASGSVYVSHDAGAHFQLSFSGLPRLQSWASTSASIRAMPNVEGDVWLTTGKALFRSSDSGKDFQELARVEESHALGFGRGAPGRPNPSLFLVGKVSGSAGFFRSDDLGASFVRLNDDLHQYGLVTHISGDPRRFGRVYLGTGGRGILVGDPR